MRRCVSAAHTGAYPRSRGGTARISFFDARKMGLSPLTRGNRRYRARWWGRSGPIPAHAGEPKSQVGAGYVSRAYPRSRGGTWNAPPSEWTMTGLSPLTRGNLGLGGEGEAGAGPIPAHAGEPSQARRSVGVTGAYPRSRGGTADALPVIQAGAGLSPLTRGNHHLTIGDPRRPGPIPAHAGEP